MINPRADVGLYDPVKLFDERVVTLFSEPQYAGGAVGWWADVREVLNAEDPNFMSPEFGDLERVSLEGAVDMLADAKAFNRDRKAVGIAYARARLAEAVQAREVPS